MQREKDKKRKADDKRLRRLARKEGQSMTSDEVESEEVETDEETDSPEPVADEQIGSNREDVV